VQNVARWRIVESASFEQRRYFDFTGFSDPLKRMNLAHDW